MGRKILGAAAGAAGIAAAGAAAGVAVRAAQQHQRAVEARRGVGDETPFGSLRSTPLKVVTDDGVDLHVEIDEPGDFGGTPSSDTDLTVVFVHGYSLNSDCWHFQCGAYRGQIRTVFYDQRSHGRSGRSDAEHSTIEQCGRDLATVIEHTVPGPCVLVGHSMGGMSIIAAAEQFPELFGGKVVGVALVSTTAGGLDPGRILFPMVPLGLSSGLVRRVVRTLDRGNLLVDRVRNAGRTVADLVTDRFAFGDDVPQHYVDFVFDMLNDTPFAVIADFFGSFASLDKFEHLDVLSRCPTAVVCGTADRITAVGHARKLHARIAGSSLLECEGAGHMVILERHEDVNDEIDDLIELAHMKLEGR